MERASDIITFNSRGFPVRLVLIVTVALSLVFVWLAGKWQIGDMLATLTPAEFSVMQRHAIIGDALCGDMRSLAPVRAIVRHHHERLDGSGYPDGLAGDAIPLIAQIVGIVDVYDAITTTRPYRGARSAREACTELSSDASRGKFDLMLVKTFVDLLAKGRLEEPQLIATS